MRKTFLAVASSAAIIMVASLIPTDRAQAMTLAASGLNAALAQNSLTESVVVVCRRPCQGCRRVCAERNPYYSGYGPGYYGNSGYYGNPGYGGYGPGVGVYGPGVGIGIGVGPRWGW
jgi:hypothetical protein